MRPEPPLSRPLGPLIDERAPAQSSELWRAIERTRESRRRAREVRRRRASRFKLALTAGGACAAAACAFVLWFSLRGAPLTTASGAALPATLAPGAAPQALDLSDGSRLTLARGSDLDVLEGSARRVTLALRGGRVRFDIKPRGPRSWRIECGPVSVEVVGTSFVLERSNDAVDVRVEHGVVVVRGPGVKDGVQRLEAGAHLHLDVAATEVVRPAVSAASHSVVAPARPVDPAAPSPIVEEPRAADLPAGVPVQVGAPSRSARVAQLLHRADAARLAGADAAAVEALQQIVVRFSDDARAGLASFELGRLRLDQLHQPALAVDDFARALRLGLPDTLAEDGQARLVEALALAGRASAACREAARYAARFPNGRATKRVSSLCPATRPVP